MNEPLITVVGNATADAEIRYLASGVACCRWTIASTPRVKRDGEWADGETVFYRCTAWRQLGESAVETITRGMRLIVQGRLIVRSYEKDGERRTSIELDVEAVGPELRYATAKVMKAERSSGGSRSSAPAAADPWGDVPPPTDEPPPF